MMSVQNRDVSAVFFSSCAHCCVIICVRNVHCTYICIVFVHIYLHHLCAHKGVIRLFLLPRLARYLRDRRVNCICCLLVEVLPTPTHTRCSCLSPVFPCVNKTSFIIAMEILMVMVFIGIRRISTFLVYSPTTSSSQTAGFEDLQLCCCGDDASHRSGRQLHALHTNHCTFLHCAVHPLNTTFLSKIWWWSFYYSLSSLLFQFLQHWHHFWGKIKSGTVNYSGIAKAPLLVFSYFRSIWNGCNWMMTHHQDYLDYL